MEQLTDIIVANVQLTPMFLALGFAIHRLLPGAVKGVLLNGGGEIVEGIVRRVNAEQSKLHEAAVEKALASYEERQFRQYGDLGEKVTQVREKLAALDARMTAHISQSRAA
jgi:hypothetical protein